MGIDSPKTAGFLDRPDPADEAGLAGRSLGLGSGPRPTAMILAAGFGRRLRPLSAIRPKPLFPVLNESMLERWLKILKAAGLGRVVVNVHHLAEQVEREAERLGRALDLEVVVSAEEEILGTGGGLGRAREFLGREPFLVVNADIYTDLPVARLLAAHRPGRLATLAILAEPGNVSLDAEGGILAFRKPRGFAGEMSRRAYSGLMVVSPKIFPLLPAGQSDVIDVFNMALARGARIGAFMVTSSIWRDMGTALAYWELNRDLCAGRQIVAPDAELRGELRGFAVIGSRAIIEAGAVVENSLVWPGVRIGAGVELINTAAAMDIPPRPCADCDESDLWLP